MKTDETRFDVTERHHTSSDNMLEWAVAWAIIRSVVTSLPPGSLCQTPFDFLLWDFVGDEVYIQPVPVVLNFFKDLIRIPFEKLNSLMGKRQE